MKSEKQKLCSPSSIRVVQYKSENKENVLMFHKIKLNTHLLFNYPFQLWAEISWQFRINIILQLCPRKYGRTGEAFSYYILPAMEFYRNVKLNYK